MTLRWTWMAAVVLTATGLAGCGGSDAPSTSDTPSAAGSTTATPSDAGDLADAGDLGDATSGDADLDGEADQGSALSAEDFCGFLADETPEVVDLQPAEYAAAMFGTALFGFYTDQGLLTDIDGADMDVLAAQGCPDAAADLLPVLGAGSFEELLSS